MQFFKNIIVSSSVITWLPIGTPSTLASSTISNSVMDLTDLTLHNYEGKVFVRKVGHLAIPTL